MRIGLVSATIPFEEDPAITLGERLEAALRAAGHQAELVLLPCAVAAVAQITQRVAYRNMEFASHYDLVVTLGSPAEVVRHPRKIVWIGPMQEHGATLIDQSRDAICARASAIGMREARHVLATSAAAAARWMDEGIAIRVMVPGDLAAAIEEILA